MNLILVKIKLGQMNKSRFIPNIKKLKRMFAINRFTDISKGLKKLSNIIIKMTNKRQEPLVSIIMNCHNGEEYLFESLKSIQSQTYKNYEVIFLTIVPQMIALKYFFNLMILDLNIFYQKIKLNFIMQEI